MIPRLLHRKVRKESSEPEQQHTSKSERWGGKFRVVRNETFSGEVTFQVEKFVSYGMTGCCWRPCDESSFSNLSDAIKKCDEAYAPFIVSSEVVAS